MQWAEPWAYGELELQPWDFYRLTVREFLLKLDGFWRRHDREWAQIGALGMWVLAPYQKEHSRSSPQELVGRPLTCFPESKPDGDDDDEPGGL